MGDGGMQALLAHASVGNKVSASKGGGGAGGGQAANAGEDSDEQVGSVTTCGILTRSWSGFFSRQGRIHRRIRADFVVPLLGPAQNG